MSAATMTRWRELVASATPEVRKQIRRSAFHEAAHGVVGRLFGASIVHVRLEPVVTGGVLVSTAGEAVMRGLPERWRAVMSAAGIVGEEMAGFRLPAHMLYKDFDERAFPYGSGQLEAIRAARNTLRRGRQTNALWALSHELVQRGEVDGVTANKILDAELWG